MDNSNIKMLSMYYSTESFLKTDFAAPLLAAIRPVIDVKEHDYKLILEKALPNLISSVNPEKILESIKDKFAKIDSGEISPVKFVGHEFSADQIVEQSQVHDTFNVLYRNFFNELTIQRADDVSFVRNYVVEMIEDVNLYSNFQEMAMLRKVFSNGVSRYPLSMDREILIEIVNTIHEVTDIVSGTEVAESVLSKAIMETIKVSAKYDAKFFL